MFNESTTFVLQLFSPVRKILAIQSRSVCCATIKSDGLFHSSPTFTVSKRFAVTDYIGVQTKSKFFEMLNKFKIVNPLNKSVSKEEYYMLLNLLLFNNYKHNLN